MPERPKRSRQHVGSPSVSTSLIIHRRSVRWSTCAQRTRSAPTPTVVPAADEAAVVVMAHPASQAATDWATKRKQQMERAARIKAERQALLKADLNKGNEQPPAELLEAVGAAGPSGAGMGRRAYGAKPPLNPLVLAASGAVNTGFEPLTEAGERVETLVWPPGDSGCAPVSNASSNPRPVPIPAVPKRTLGAPPTIGSAHAAPPPPPPAPAKPFWSRDSCSLHAAAGWGGARMAISRLARAACTRWTCLSSVARRMRSVRALVDSPGIRCTGLLERLVERLAVRPSVVVPTPAGGTDPVAVATPTPTPVVAPAMAPTDA